MRQLHRDRRVEIAQEDLVGAIDDTGVGHGVAIR
jgi:hypothetical protein